MGPTTQILDDLAKAVARAGKRATRDAAQEILIETRQRTLRGVSVQGVRFVQYAKSTQERKGRSQPVSLFEEDGRRRKGGHPHMLDSMVVQNKGTNTATVTLRGNRAARVGISHQFGWKGVQPRAWFGVNPRVARRLFNTMAATITESITYSRRRRFQVVVRI